MPQTKSVRGGYRPGAGRKPLPGDLRRKDARIENEFITLATVAGEGNFSNDLRRMLTYAKLVWRRRIQMYEPPTGQPLLVFDGGGWKVATVDDLGNWSRVDTDAQIESVDAWCYLPPTPADLPLMDLPLE